ncbi:LysR family transcriptional regulator [Bradyrhizobium sp.]|uniref:LysR family transcriptional regulator n=1 Tax=Bradyrhizobium sp. TaxID=376 RepID=UPI0039E6AFEC
MTSTKRHINVPTEIARTILTVQEVGSFTKAAELLGITQPAISSQLRRIETLVGGPLFSKNTNRNRVTELGLAVVHQCRKMIEANDQILAIGGIIRNDRLLRLGLSSLLVRAFLVDSARAVHPSVSVHSDGSAALARRFLDGQLDVVCLLDGSGLPSIELHPYVQREFTDELVWVQSPDFELAPGAPIPIITWAGENDPMTRSLAAQGLAYRIAFSGGDFDTKKMAVEAGLGLTCLPKRLVPADLVVATEFDLPALPQTKGLLCVNRDLDPLKANPTVDRLISLFFTST